MTYLGAPNVVTPSGILDAIWQRYSVAFATMVFVTWGVREILPRLFRLIRGDQDGAAMAKTMGRIEEKVDTAISEITGMRKRTHDFSNVLQGQQANIETVTDQIRELFERVNKNSEDIARIKGHLGINGVSKP